MTKIQENTLAKKQLFIDSFDSSPAMMKSNHIQDYATKAIGKLEQLSFPTSKSEAWKYTRTGKLLNQKFKTSQGGNNQETIQFHIPLINAIELVFINGVFQKDSSQTLDNDIIVVIPMSEAVIKYPEIIQNYYGSLTNNTDEIFTVLNGAFPSDGIFIHIKKPFVEKTIHVVNLLNEDSYSFSRNLIIAEKSSQAQIVSSYHSTSSTVFCNQVTEVIVKDNARITIDKIQQESNSCFHISSDYAIQEKDSEFHINTYSLTGGWIRNNLKLRSNGSGTTTDLYGLYQPKEKHHVDNHTLVEHGSTDGVSNELYKGLIYDHAQGVFNGKVIVEPDAQRTNAYQQNANILMSDDANINSKPELEIYADDVKCSHGSTIGQFDEEALFYLMTRGISRYNAKQLMTEAFLSEVIEHCEVIAVQELILKELSNA